MAALYVVSGASRGFGRALVEGIARAGAPAGRMDFLLIARSREGLETTKRAIAEIAPNSRVSLACIDLSTPAAATAFPTELFQSTYAKAVLVNNAGTAMPYKRTDEMSEEDFLSAWNLSIVSSLNLSKQFLQLQSPAKIVVHVSSLLAVKGFSHLAAYSVAKASAEAFHRALAVEHPELRVLNYSPGPMETDMLEHISVNHPESALKSVWERAYRGALKPADSVQRLLHLLERDQYANAAHVDFYDVDDDGNIAK